MSSNLEQRTRQSAISAAAAIALLDDVDTAVIGVDLDTLDTQLQTLRGAFPEPVRHTIAIKTMPHPAMLAHLVASGFGLEAASLEEVQLALGAGAAPTDVIFDSPVKTRSEIEWCQTNLPGGLLNANSIGELSRYPNTPTFQVGLRINPELATGAPSRFDVSGERSKFGVAISSTLSTITDACIEAGVTALHMHIGSQVPNVDAHVEAVGRVLEIARSVNAAVADRGNHPGIESIDIGGGIRAERDGHALMTEYGERLATEHPALFDFDVRTEFGQWVQSSAGWAASRIESVEDRAVPMAFLHLGADFFMRDAYSGSGSPNYSFGVVRSDGTIATMADPDGPTQCYDLVGPLCFAGDVLARDQELPVLAEGDWLVIAGTGANTLGLWSRHCSRAVPRVVAARSDECVMWSERRSAF